MIEHMTGSGKLLFLRARRLDQILRRTELDASERLFQIGHLARPEDASKPSIGVMSCADNNAALAEAG